MWQENKSTPSLLPCLLLFNEKTHPFSFILGSSIYAVSHPAKSLNLKLDFLCSILLSHQEPKQKAPHQQSPWHFLTHFRRSKPASLPSNNVHRQILHDLWPVQILSANGVVQPLCTVAWQMARVKDRTRKHLTLSPEHEQFMFILLFFLDLTIILLFL